MQESMRMLPVAAGGTSRVFPHDVAAGDYVIPANTLIWLQFFCVQNSPRAWDQPERFMPVGEGR